MFLSDLYRRGKLTVGQHAARIDVSALARFAPPWVKNASWRIDGHPPWWSSTPIPIPAITISRTAAMSHSTFWRLRPMARPMHRPAPANPPLPRSPPKLQPGRGQRGPGAGHSASPGRRAHGQEQAQAKNRSESGNQAGAETGGSSYRRACAKFSPKPFRSRCQAHPRRRDDHVQGRWRRAAFCARLTAWVVLENAPTDARLKASLATSPPAWKRYPATAWAFAHHLESARRNRGARPGSQSGSGDRRERRAAAGGDRLCPQSVRPQANFAFHLLLKRQIMPSN